MPRVSRKAVDDVLMAVSERWREADPLLPPARGLPDGCGEALVVPGDRGRLSAIGVCDHYRPGTGSLDEAFGAALRFRLTARVAGRSPGPGLCSLLNRWRDHLARLPEAAGEDTAAMVTWPSRDTGGIHALLAHGLRPVTVIAVRRARRPAPGQPAEPWRGQPAPPDQGALRLRPAAPCDAGQISDLVFQLTRFEQALGSVTVRPGTLEAIRASVTSALTRPGRFAWLADRGGRAEAVAMADPPNSATWIAAMTAAGPAGYFGWMYVAPAERGKGVGTALAARVHAELEAAGSAVTMLHYAHLNPLSAPFWSVMGYRPLWTIWEARPALALR